jgi:protein-S-isoprenylcysteine O-methyltransferase Ste14
MLIGLFQTTIILWTAVTFYIIDFILIGKFDKQRKATGTGRSWDYTLLMFLIVAFVAAQPIILPGLSVRIMQVSGLVLQMLGLACLAGSLRLNIWARQHLQQFYSERVEIQPEHAIIDTGPYAYVRHPVFTSLFGLVIGLMMVNLSLPTVILALYTFWDFTRAARQEEALLAHNLPGYQAYMRRTNAFIPSLKRLRGI